MATNFSIDDFAIFDILDGTDNESQSAGMVEGCVPIATSQRWLHYEMNVNPITYITRLGYIIISNRVVIQITLQRDV